MRVFTLVAALSVLASPNVFAQSTQPPQPAAPAKAEALPEARTIIDRHVELSGGKAALLKHTSSYATGTFEMPAQGLSGTFEAWGAAPNRSLLKITIPGVGTVVDGFDGTNGWSINPATGPMILQGKQLEQKMHDSDFYGELHDPAKYESMKTVEKTTFDGRPCYKISLVRKGGGEDIEFYDVATGLKAGALMTRESPMGAITATETRTDYKKFGDLMSPTVIKVTAMGVDQVLKFQAVEFDKVDASVFAMPVEIKALIK